MNESWKNFLNSEFKKLYFQKLSLFLHQEYLHHTIYPSKVDVFNAFNFCSIEDTKVVIIGQDPYHGKGQANGLCFSVKEKVAIPPSLRNIFKEIHDDLKKPIPENGNLERWAKQGVLLLNNTLTVRENLAGSHRKMGWEEFTNSIISFVSQKKFGMVFLLWGKDAQCKESLIDYQKHLILKSAHPSPLSAFNGFFGCKHFSQTNTYLALQGLNPINW